MAEYEIVDKPSEESLRTHHWSTRKRWPLIFETLPVNKMIKMQFETKKLASFQARSIRGCLYNKRYNIRIHARILPEGDKFILYVWRE